MTYFIKIALIVFSCFIFSKAYSEVYIPHMICPGGDREGWLPSGLDGQYSWPTPDDARAAGDRYAQRMALNGGRTGCRVDDIYVAATPESSFISSLKMTKADKKEQQDQKVYYAGRNPRALLACSHPIASWDLTTNLMSSAANDSPQVFGTVMTTGIYRESCSLIKGAPSQEVINGGQVIAAKGNIVYWVSKTKFGAIGYVSQR